MSMLSTYLAYRAMNEAEKYLSIINLYKQVVKLYKKELQEANSIRAKRIDKLLKKIEEELI